ncbi:iron-sulfur cluster assembly scaffold protein [Metabacillus sp. Hm71]|uniref:iron-sulfur cluster assembly scaffold protein n=1 Tax=Metabacillus sp. Hm71 TaxID=3450743 RepID=UPI003F429442
MFNDIICEHFMNPRNIGEMENHDYVVEIGNPICGDTVHMFLKVEEQQITEVTYRAYGCSTSIATASIVSEVIKGKTFDELTSITRDEVADWLGELEPAQYHCIDIGLSIIHQCSHPIQKNLEKKEFLVEGEGAF